MVSSGTSSFIATNAIVFIATIVAIVEKLELGLKQAFVMGTCAYETPTLLYAIAIDRSDEVFVSAACCFMARGRGLLQPLSGRHWNMIHAVRAPWPF